MVVDADAVIQGLLPGSAGAASLIEAADRLAALLLGGDRSLADIQAAPGRLGIIEFVDDIVVRPLRRLAAPADVWAVDGGQALIADARCLQVVAARAARVRFRAGRCTLEECDEPRVSLLGGEPQRSAALTALGVEGIAADSAVDLGLLRDRWEWDGVRRCVEDADDGALILVDGDLQPDWRIPSRLLTGLLASAAARGIVIAGITKHSSLSVGGAPLLAHLEREAGEFPLWWARVGFARTDLGGVQVVAARLDPDARFSFRIDLPPGADPEHVLGQLCALCNDAAFPGYPYPLTVADRLAAMPGWLRTELRFELDDALARSNVPEEVRERALADRHRYMERN